MPGAISGNIISISEKKGVIDSRRGQVSFTNWSDSLKTRDLRTRYAEGDDVVFFLETDTMPPHLFAHTVCPERELQEGYATISRVDVKCANARCDDGQLVFFSSGRLSKLFRASADQDLGLVLAVGDRIYYRAMRQHDTSCLKATDVLLCNNPGFRPPNFRRERSLFGPLFPKHSTAQNDESSDQQQSLSSATDARDRINEQRSEKHNTRTDGEERRHHKSHAVVKQEPLEEEVVESDSMNNSRSRRSKRRANDSHEDRRAKRMRTADDPEQNIVNVQPKTELMQQVEQYIRAHDPYEQKNQLAPSVQKTETAIGETQTDLLIVKAWQKLGAMILSDKVLVKVLADDRPDILAAAVAAVNMGLAELKSHKVKIEHTEH